jgi:superfamily II DNA or RNA helicase
MMELMPHQKRIVEANPQKAILNWEMRCGKSFPASIWIAQRTGNRYIICLKKNKKEWQAMDTGGAIVLTKEEFKKASLPTEVSAIVVDEAHYFASALFVGKGKKRSGLAEALYLLVQRCPNMDVLLLTATPVRQDAWSLHTLLCYIGQYYDWKTWRNEFFELQARPFLPVQPWMKRGEVPTAWMPKKDWRIQIRKYIEKHTDIVSLRDVVEDLPPAEEKIVRMVRKEKYKKPEDEVVTWVHEHKFEQQGKASEILALGYRKVIVVCMYTEQIDEMARELGAEGRTVFVLDGRTKDQAEVIRLAQEAEECYLICQSAMGEAWDGWMFGAMVFASMSHSCYQFTQMMGRQRHPKHLKVTETIFLLGGRWDERIYETVAVMGKDFNAHSYLNEDVL